MNEHNLPEESFPQEDIYQTGRTQPPKSHRGIIAILLIAVILLGGIASLLGFVNVRLLARLSKDTLETDLALSFSLSDLPTATAEKTEETTAEEAFTPLLELASSPTGAPNHPQEGGLPLQEIYASAIESVVSISCITENGVSTGTGVVLSADGYMVTNSHVVAEAVSIQAQLHDDRILPADLVGADAITDLAVLRVDATDLVPALFGDSSSLQVGDAVAAIGDPLGTQFRGTMTDGIISAINRDVLTGGRTMTLIQTNAALNSGNSGGPLLNCFGQVIGINTMKVENYMDTAGAEGLGFAIPSSTVKEIVEQLVQQGYVSGRPWLGIRGQEVHFFYQLYKQYPQGLYITEVDSASDAAAKGICPGDILLSIDGKRITDADSFSNTLYDYGAGDTVTAVIYRSGRQYSLSLTVGEAN